MSGAVSPIALERARIVPVRIPGMATGRTCHKIVCHCVAPRANDASLMEKGIDFNDSLVVVIMTGRMRRVKVKAPVRILLSR